MKIDTSPSDLVNGFHVFLDSAYFDMWGVEVPGNRDWNKVLHFNTRDEAEAYVLNLDKRLH